jgi:septal ring factor EnvC (AmiA/AmiB activator)
MHRAIREQSRCKELHRARKHCAHLEKQLDAAEETICEQDEQIATLVEVLQSLTTQIVELECTDLYSSFALSTSLGVLARYKDPIQRAINLSGRTFGDG